MRVTVGLSLLAVGLILLTACSSGALPLPPNSLTVSPLATQVSDIRTGTATPSSTAQAVATRLAPTLQVVQQTVGPIATSVAQAPVHIVSVSVMPDDTTVVVQNSSGSQVDLTGWTLMLGANIPLTLPSITLAPGQTQTLHMSAGTSTDTDIYLNLASVGAIATTFAPGQRVVLVTPENQIASIASNT